MPEMRFVPGPRTLNVITDAAGVVVDIASEEANLSRGYTFPGYQEYDGLEARQVGDIRIGDTFDGLAVTPNAALRQAQAGRAANESKVQVKMRELAIADLKSKGELPADYT